MSMNDILLHNLLCLIQIEERIIHFLLIFVLIYFYLFLMKILYGNLVCDCYTIYFLMNQKIQNLFLLYNYNILFHEVLICEFFEGLFFLLFLLHFYFLLLFCFLFFLSFLSHLLFYNLPFFFPLFFLHHFYFFLFFQFLFFLHLFFLQEQIQFEEHFYQILLY